MFKIKKKLNKAFYYMCAVFITSFPGLAAAAETAEEQGFETFKDTIADLITGSLGKAVALIALLLGGLIGLAQSSAWPALTGLAIAAIFGLGPFLIETIFTTFGAVNSL